MIHNLSLLARYTMETSWSLGLLGFLLICVPILGIWAIHKYDWQHWEPFDKREH